MSFLCWVLRSHRWEKDPLTPDGMYLQDENVPCTRCGERSGDIYKFLLTKREHDAIVAETAAVMRRR